MKYRWQNRLGNWWYFGPSKPFRRNYWGVRDRGLRPWMRVSWDVYKVVPRSRAPGRWIQGAVLALARKGGR